MNCGELKTELYVRRRRNALIFATVLAALSVAMWSGTSSAGLPLYAQDAHTQLVDWEADPPVLVAGQRQLGEIIRDNAIFYLENGAWDNDAPYFANVDPLRQVPSALGHYVFYGNLRYSGSPGWVDPLRHANATESHFYHANDPASLVAWRLPDGRVRLHWTPDLRYVTVAEMLMMYDGQPIPAEKRVTRYLITRRDPSGTTTLPIIDTDWDGETYDDPELFATTDDGGAGAISYQIQSIPYNMSASEAVDFSSGEVAVTPATGPHFWAVKSNYQEPYYAAAEVNRPGATAPLTWELTFYVDQVLPEPANLVIERVTRVKRNSLGVETIEKTPIAALYDSVTGKISCTITTQDIADPQKPWLGTDWNLWGGVAYRLVYTPPTGSSVMYPEPFIKDAISRSRFMWTSINSRTLGCGWYNYMMNCEEVSWTATVKEMCNRLAAGIVPPNATSVAYNRLLLDVVMGVISDHHNVVRPFELATDESCRAANITNMESICADFATFGADFGIVCNTADLAFVDAFTVAGQPKPGFAGVMDENFTTRGDGVIALANLLWKFRGHPFKHNLFKNDMAFHSNFPDRKQAVAAFLMARDPVVQAGQEPRALFGYGEWENAPSGQSGLVPIFPEQSIGVLGPSFGDPFADTVWPGAGTGGWSSVIASHEDAVDWLSAHAPGFVYEIAGRNYGVGRWELDDGLPNVPNEVIAVFDFGTEPGSYTLAELLSSGGIGTWHKLVMDSDPIVDGGVVATVPVSTTSAIPTEPDSVQIYFSANVHSPVVIANALAPMPASGGGTGILKLRAGHWNFQELAELRVDGRDWGWGADVQLHDPDRDGIYCSDLLTTKPEGVAIGADSLAYVAIGNDGLMSYGSVTVQATAADVLIDASAEYPLLAQSHDGKVVLAVNVTSYVPLSATAPVEVIAPTIFGSSTPVLLWDDGEAGLGNRLGAEDAVAGDGIFTSDRVAGVVNAAGTFSADVVVHPASGDSVSGAVSVTSVLSRAEFGDKTSSSGDIAMNVGVPRYAMAYANTSSDHMSGKKIMIVTFGDVDTYPLILENQSSNGTAAYFVEQSGNNWLGGGVAHLPSGSRGVCFGDFGGGESGEADGKQDFFLCGATGSHLYVNNGTLEAPQFVDVTETAFPSLADRDSIAGAMSAAWSDFDLDGDLDLFVATSDYSGPMSEIANQVGVNFGGAFFRNNGNGTFQLKPMSMLSGSGSALTGVWAHLTPESRWPYLIMPWISSDGCMLAYRPGVSVGFSVFAVVGGQLSNLNSIVVCDYNHDNRPDLLVTDHGGGGKAAILRNDYNPTTGLTSFQVACTLGAGRIWSGATVGDFDGNGQDDILLLPEFGAPALYMAQSYSTTPTFTEDIAFTLGLRAGATSGCVATDQGGSRLPDISLGRAGERVMYQNLRAVSGPHPGRWVEISLGSVGNSNSSLIGTEVTIQQAGKSWTKTVDGGSGRGGQDANSFRFFLEEDASNVAVSVSYPSGDADFLASVPVDSVYAVVEDTPVTLKTGTKTDPDPTFTYELGPGTMDWVFRWRTVGIKGDQRQDAVTIENYLGYTDTSPCFMGIEPGTPLVLHWGDPGVTFKISWDGTDWVHEARWAGLPCASGCQYRFKVTSGIGNGVTTTSTQAKVIPALEFCMPDPDPNQQ